MLALSRRRRLPSLQPVATPRRDRCSTNGESALRHAPSAEIARAEAVAACDACRSLSAYTSTEKPKLQGACTLRSDRPHRAQPSRVRARPWCDRRACRRRRVGRRTCAHMRGRARPSGRGRVRRASRVRRLRRRAAAASRARGRRARRLALREAAQYVAEGACGARCSAGRCAGDRWPRRRCRRCRSEASSVRRVARGSTPGVPRTLGGAAVDPGVGLYRRVGAGGGRSRHPTPRAGEARRRRESEISSGERKKIFCPHMKLPDLRGESCSRLPATSP